MTHPWSIADLGLLFSHPGHQGNEQRPRDENVGIQHRDAEHALGDVEQREDREIEQHAAEHAQRNQPLRAALRILHLPSSPLRQPLCGKPAASLMPTTAAGTWPCNSFAERICSLPQPAHLYTGSSTSSLNGARSSY